MIKRVLVLILILAAAVWLRNSHYADYLTLSALKSNAEALKAYTDVHFALSASMFVAAYVVVAGLNIPGAGQCARRWAQESAGVTLGDG